MKAALDHVGIAVDRLNETLAFYRDALGLDVSVPEEVPSQRVRAHMLDTGGASLELLEATAADSPIAAFLAKRGPGLHHITLRVDDLRAVLRHLATRGVRRIDAEPRPGAHGSLVAFIHPSAARGVLVELKQAAPPAVRLETASIAWGDLTLTALHDGPFRLDGGAMFGVVPKPLWEKLAPADDRNRIQLAMRPLLVESSWGRLLVDCGVGEKMPEKARDIYALDRTVHLDHALAERGLDAAAIPFVLATHLHFDHFGGATMRGPNGLVPRFPNARYLIRDAEWEDATHPHERNRASYLQDDFVPLKPAAAVDFYTGDITVKPGVRVVRTGGHTGQHQIVYLESGGKTAVFAADLIPTIAHLQDPWVMGYDLFPMETLAFKRGFIREAIDREYLIFFEHDPLVLAGIIREQEIRGAVKRWVEQVL
jgi:methylmalonyl-CoA epimerase